MRLPLPERWVRHLSHLPESGMGYQRVDIKLKNGSRINDVIVLYMEELEYPVSVVPFTADDIAEIKLHYESVD